MTQGTDTLTDPDHELAAPASPPQRSRLAELPEERTARLGAVLQEAAHAVFMKDTEGRYLFVNRAAAQLLGRAAEQIVGRTDAELLSPETAAAIMENDRRILAAGETVTLEEVGTSSGTTRNHLSTKGVFRNTSGTVTGLYGIARDSAGSEEIARHLAEIAAEFETPHEAILMLRPPDLRLTAALLARRQQLRREQAL